MLLFGTQLEFQLFNYYFKKHLIKYFTGGQGLFH